MVVVKLIFAAVFVAYPLIVYFALGVVDARTLAFVLVALLIVRIALLKLVGQRIGSLPQSKYAIWALLAICVVVLFSNSPELLRYYPIAINVILFAVFFESILNPPTVIEKIARIQSPDLPEAGVRHTRRVTIVWCCFFIFNGSMALYTSLGTELRTWAIYNGVVSYSIMGILFVGEYIIRLKIQSKNRRAQNSKDS